MSLQPKQFSPEHSAMFQDASVVTAYRHRPSYPPETFALLNTLMDHTTAPLRVLDAGCGTGQMTQGLLPYVDLVDAVDLSPAMIAAGRQMTYGADARINWLVGSIEQVDLHEPYALIVAAASLHWMPWPATLARFAQLLSANGYLALVEERAAAAPWGAALTPLIVKYSLNQDFQPYTMVSVAAELQRLGLFQQAGILETQPVRFVQSLAAWIEAIHARNGFSRERMGAERAAAFDHQVAAVMRDYCRDQLVTQQLSARIVFGKPLSPVK